MGLGAGCEVEAKCWLRCMILQAAGSTTVWLVWQITFLSTAGKYLWFVPFAWTCFWFLVFQASQLLFLIGKFFVTTFQEKEAVSALDLISGVWKMTCIMVVGTSVEPEATRHLSAKISTTRDQVVFVCLCTISGVLSLPIGVRGAALGLVYACLPLFQEKEVLAFPLVQRNFACSLKIVSSRVLLISVKLTVVVVPVIAGFICAERKFALHDILADGFSFFIRQQIVFVFRAFCATVCWELCHHFVQVV